MNGNQPGPSNANLVVIPSIIFCLVSPTVVAIRFWSRTRFSNNVGADDWTIFVSLIFSMAVSIGLLAACSFGFGKHISSLSPENKIMALKLFYIVQIFYKVNINLTKASILLLYLRIFVQRPFRIICWIMLAVIAAYGVASTTASIFQCSPVPRAWNKHIAGTCINITENWFANAGFSITTDVIILCLPMPILYSLKLPNNRKLALMLVFALGGFVVVTSTLRLTTLNISGKSLDPTYQIVSSLWTVIEENVGIICACLPMFRLPLSILFPKLFPNRDGSSNGASAKLSNSSSARSGSIWVPPLPSNKANNIRLTSITGSLDGILERDLERDGKITKSTHFDLTYGSGSSEARDFDIERPVSCRY